MTDEEKRLLKEEMARRQVGYDLMEQERRERIRTTTVEEVGWALQWSVEIARKRGPRPLSELTQWHVAMAKLNR